MNCWKLHLYTCVPAVCYNTCELQPDWQGFRRRYYTVNIKKNNKKNIGNVTVTLRNTTTLTTITFKLELELEKLEKPFWFTNVFMAWHRHTSLTNFVIQQSRSFESVCVPLCLMNCPFPVPGSQPTATELFQSPMYGSGSAYHICSRHFPSSALAWRHTSSNSVTRNYCC